MNILGLYWGICSAAALLKGDSLIGAVSEERFTRKKNDDHFPLRSIEFCLSLLDKSQKLDAVALASYEQSYWNTLKHKALWSIDDYITEQKHYWFPRLYKSRKVSPQEYLSEKIDVTQYPEDFWSQSLGNRKMIDEFNTNERRNIVSKATGVSPDKVYIMEHHRCHAYYANYASCIKNEPLLAMTLDGWGDGCNATINIFDENGRYKRVFQSREANIGRIYRYITLILGMKPNEHEYKVMGLAPYAGKAITGRAYELFKSTLYVEGLEFKWNVAPDDSYYWFKDRLEGCRFDAIAAALQQWTEELICQWVKNAVKEFGIKKVLFSGGVAMNARANGKAASIEEVESFFVPGSASDDSLAPGAVYALAEDLSEEKSRAPKKRSELKSFSHLYLGPNAETEQEYDAIKALDRTKYSVKKGYSARDIAASLAKGKIVARCCGPMEFGQRALGNRSILADPVHIGVIHKINAAIKNRDFWMPFAPVILDTFAHKYIMNPKGHRADFMTIIFNTTDRGWADMPAACHQADHTTRPQILIRESNPSFYELLMDFSHLTGRGALINTSFNLHGYPIVNTPQDALYVFENSSIDILILNFYVLFKVSSQ